MKKIFCLTFLAFFIFIGSMVHSFAARGQATVYKVTMKKLELCTGTSSVDDCQNSVTVGTETKTVDIASVEAGAAAAQYGTATLLPLGAKYTHVRVHIDRKFIIKGAPKTDAGKRCPTAAIDDDSYAGTEANQKYTHKPGLDESESNAAAESNEYMVNEGAGDSGTGYIPCTATDCSSVAAATDTDMYGSCQEASCAYKEQLNDTDYASTTSIDESDDTMTMVYKLSAPYTVTMIPPTVDIGFGTMRALSANNVTGTICQVWAEEPIVTISIK